MKKLLLFLSLVILPFSVEAAEMFFATEGEVVSGSDTRINIMIATESERINTISGTFVLPEGVDIKRFVSGESVVTQWIETPRLSGEEKRTVTFAGIIPGGYEGRGNVLSFIATFEKGKYALGLNEGLVLLNDGEGTSAKLSLKEVSLEVSEGSGENYIYDDAIPPEEFDLIIASDEAVFDGKPFLSFGAVDKGSGISRYEYASAFIYPWGKSFKEAVSPHLIPRGDAWKKMYVKAIDNAGNERVVHVSGEKYQYTLVLFGILFLSLCALYLGLRRRS